MGNNEDKCGGVIMENTVVILEAGIGAMTLGFQKAGCTVIAAFEKDEKAIELYRKNVGGEIFHYKDIANINFDEVPEADILACSLLDISAFVRKNLSRWDVDHLAVIKNLMAVKKPKAVCLVFSKRLLEKAFLTDFQNEIANLGYSFTYQKIATEKMTGLPIAESKVYFIASLSANFKEIEFPASCDFTYSVGDICEGYDKKSQSGSQKDTFLCWKNGTYVETKLADTNLFKLPLVCINGYTRKITHKELARLKGFPDEIEMTASNKAWLYRQLVYSPNVEVMARIAEVVVRVLRETPLQKSGAIRSYLFEALFEKYLEKSTGIFGKAERSVTDIWDFRTHNQTAKIYFELKIYNSDYALATNLRRASKRFADLPREDNEMCVLVVGNVVEASIKEKIQEQYQVFVWDIRNLLWLFEPYPDIKNELVALLSYSIDEIEAEAPIPNLSEEKSEETKKSNWKKQLLEIKAGREAFQVYEKVCTEILRYVLGDYLSLWAVQEKSNDELYRFDLCCKIKHGVNQDFFDTVQNYFHTKYIVFEFKNYAKKISQKEIYTTEKYLYEKALRSVAIIISRQGADANALSAARGCLRENGKLILCLSDEDLLALIQIKDKDEQPTAEYFEALLDDLLIHLEK